MESKEWKEHFQQLKIINDNIARMEIRAMRSEIFQSTVNIVRAGEYTSENGNKITLDDQEKIISGTQFYSQEITLDEHQLEEYDEEYLVENKDCLDVAKELLDEGYHPVVLNMANRHNPGGGVLYGAGAQEENLFRRTNLFCSLYQYAPYAAQYGLPQAPEQYPMDRNHGGIYTPQAQVFRGNESEGYPLLDTPFHVSFISVAGLCCPDVESGKIVPQQAERLKNKIRTIFRIALTNGHDAIVLGALGCGAFCNPPEHVAQLFEEVADEPEFNGHFALLDFAILEDHNSHRSHNLEGNFKPFHKRFGNKF